MPKFRSKTRKGDQGDAEETVSRDQHTAAVEQADLADDGPKIEQETTEVAGTQEMGVEFAGAAGAEALSDLIAQTDSDESTSEFDADEPSTTRKGRGDYDELTDDDSNSVADRIASSEDPWASRPRDVFGARSPRTSTGGEASSTSYGGGGAEGGGDSQTASTGGGGLGGREVSIQDPLTNPLTNPITGEGQPSPTGSFTDYVQDKTGIDEQRAGGEAGGGPAPGSGRSVAEGGFLSDVGKGVKAVKDNTSSVTEASTPRGAAMRDALADDDKIWSSHTSSDGVVTVTRSPQDGSTTVVNRDNGTTTVLKADGSSVTTNTATGKEVDRTGPVKDPGPSDVEPVTLEEKLNDPLFREYQKSKNAGGGGDGATDPSETDDVSLKEGQAPTVQEVHDEAVGMFGQPAGDDFGSGPRGGTITHPDADVIDPNKDQDLVGGPQRTENPGVVMPNTEPVVGMPADDTAVDETEGESDDGGGSYLPPGDFTPVDAPPDLPDVDADAPG